MVAAKGCGSRRRAPSGGGATTLGNRHPSTKSSAPVMIGVRETGGGGGGGRRRPRIGMLCRCWSPAVLLFFSILQVAQPTRNPWIYDGVDEKSLEEARKIGEQARIEYLNRIQGVADPQLRNEYYLDGLELCNAIDRPWTNSITQAALLQGRSEDAKWLEKAGLKEFTSYFMTFPPELMVNVSKAACSKHEKQLQCGAVYEGIEVTRDRIAELNTIGNHKMMFDNECRDPGWVGRVYPCIGKNVAEWMAECKEKVNNYAVLRDSVNSRIEQLYENSVATIKNMKDNRADAEEIFSRTMTSIVKLEGAKCAVFKQMRLCVMRKLLGQCGPEAARAFNTSTSLGYMTTERRERLSLDFKVFQYPSHPNCGGL